MTQRTDNEAELEIAAQVAALRAQVDRLLGQGGETAGAVAREVHRATKREVETLAAQARSEPVATALFVLGGAVLGFVLGRAAR